jgi:hypothetical protein
MLTSTLCLRLKPPFACMCCLLVTKSHVLNCFSVKLVSGPFYVVVIVRVTAHSVNTPLRRSASSQSVINILVSQSVSSSCSFMFFVSLTCKKGEVGRADPSLALSAFLNPRNRPQPHSAMMASWVSLAVCGTWLVTQATAQTTRELNSDHLSHSSISVHERAPTALCTPIREQHTCLLAKLPGTCTRRLNAMRRCAFLHVRGCEAQTPVQ